MRSEFWRDRKVFLTGHSGFKGGWLSLWLQKMEAAVIGYSLAPDTNPSLFEAAQVDTFMKSWIDDIRDGEKLAYALIESDAEIVFHLAAQPLVRASYSDPITTYETNVMGTIYLLQAIRQCPRVKVVVVVTTDKCYENREWYWPYREIDPMGGHDPYSSSKAATEIAVASFRRSFFDDGSVRLSTVRAGNVIGGGDWADDRLIPDMVRSIKNNQEFVIRYPNAIRPWQHVMEPLRGYLDLAEAMWDGPEDLSGAWNFGPMPDSEQPVSFIADRFCDSWGGGATWRTVSSDLHEANFLKLDSSKARSRIGWRPRLELEDALEYTVDWYKAYYAGQDSKAYTLRQIDRYLDLISTPYE